MARNRASTAFKVASAKSSKMRSKIAPPPTSSGERKKSSRSYSGGNPVCPRETPVWQKPITNFFPSLNPKESNEEEIDNEPGPSKVKPKRNVIQSDDEGEAPSDDDDVPKNAELDESFSLEPLTGENCHKIDEYCLKKNRVKKDYSRQKKKRSLEETTSDEECEHISKKTKTDQSSD